MQRRLQFRLATLLLATTAVAVGVFAWMRFAAPHVTGVQLESEGLGIHLSEAAGRRILPATTDIDALANDPDVLLHATFVLISWPSVALALALLLALLIGAYFVCRVFAGRLGANGK